MNNRAPADMSAVMYALERVRCAPHAKTPLKVNSDIRRFCATISTSRPVYIDYTELGLMPNWCHLNVALLTEMRGGKYVSGWLISKSSVMIDAVHHGVWLSPDHTLVDATPKDDGEQRVLFLPDPTRPYDFANNLGWQNKFWVKGAHPSVNKTFLADRRSPVLPDLCRINQYRSRVGLRELEVIGDIPCPPISRWSDFTKPRSVR